MSIFKKIKNQITEPGLSNELCEHLRQIGIEATVLDSKSPDAGHYTPTLGIFASTLRFVKPLGIIKVEGRNIGRIEVYKYLKEQGPIMTGI